MQHSFKLFNIFCAPYGSDCWSKRNTPQTVLIGLSFCTPTPASFSLNRGLLVSTSYQIQLFRSSRALTTYQIFNLKLYVKKVVPSAIYACVILAASRSSFYENYFTVSGSGQTSIVSTMSLVSLESRRFHSNDMSVQF